MALTKKQDAFVKHIVNNPKDSATKAALATYGKPEITRRSAEQIAYENLRKPEIVTELARYTTEVEDTLYRAVTDWGTHDRPRQREIALDAAKYIHDKVHGRATQRVETSSKTVTINIDLTTPESSLPGDPTPPTPSS